VSTASAALADGAAAEPDAPTVPVGAVARLVREALREGFAAEQLLAGTDLDPRRLDTPGLRISPRTELTVLANAVAARLPRRLAIAARARSVDDYGLLGYAMMSCATLAHAVRLALRYARTAGPLVAIDHHVERGDAVIVARDELGVGALMPWIVEPLFGGLPALLEGLLGRPVPVREVRFAHPPGEHAAAMRELFDAPVRYNAGVCEFRFDASLLDVPLPRADADTAHILEQSCRTLLRELEGSSSLASRITRDLLARPGDVPTAPAMAERLAMSERTLRRRLADAGTSYQGVLDDVRRGLAEDYLRSTALSVQEIAELLGYSEATNFCRAFVKWTGATPGACRRAGRDADA
jgi:AraC-like DNA-binding protein